MTTVIYEIVEHDGGWSFKVGDTIAQAYSTREAAVAAAERAAREQRSIPPEETDIEYETPDGRWTTEHVGSDQVPETKVKD